MAWGSEEDDEDGEVVEVTEEDLMKDWIARGLDPADFDPQRLLEIWHEAEESELEVKCSMPVLLSS